MVKFLDIWKINNRHKADIEIALARLPQQVNCRQVEHQQGVVDVARVLYDGKRSRGVVRRRTR